MDFRITASLLSPVESFEERVQFLQLLGLALWSSRLISFDQRLLALRQLPF